MVSVLFPPFLLCNNKYLYSTTGSDVDYQKTVGTLPLQLLGMLQRLFGLAKKRKIDILSGLDGVVHAGEMLVVLGKYCPFPHSCAVTDTDFCQAHPVVVVPPSSRPSLAKRMVSSLTKPHTSTIKESHPSKCTRISEERLSTRLKWTCTSPT